MHRFSETQSSESDACSPNNDLTRAGGGGWILDTACGWDGWGGGGGLTYVTMYYQHSLTKYSLTCVSRYYISFDYFMQRWH